MATPLIGSQYQVTPVSASQNGTFLFTLVVNITGGYVMRYEYNLTLVCGVETIGLNIIEDDTFSLPL